MKKQENIDKMNAECFIITAGCAYLDIDAYACMVAMAELLRLKGKMAIAYSTAPFNYSICQYLIKEGQVSKELPSFVNEGNAHYIIVDVSDPDFLGDFIPLDLVTEVYDHHVGFEKYWETKVGNNSHIEFLGAAATLIYRKWEEADMVEKMTQSTALLLISAILDNTLNLTSANTTNEDKEVFNKLCRNANINENWCADYFLSVQSSVENDLKNAIFGDIKTVNGNKVLPQKVAQLTVYDVDKILYRTNDIRQWFENCDSWMINIIDIKNNCSYFLCDDASCQKKIEKVFDTTFNNGIAKLKTSYLRKEIIKRTININ